MMPLYSILTSEGAGTGNLDWLKYLPMIVAIVGIVILLVAFCIGFKKGGRRVSWGGLIWIVAGAAYFLVQHFLGAFILEWVRPLVSGFVTEESVIVFAASFATAVACVFAALLLYGLFALIFRPRYTRKRKNDDIFTKDEESIEYDEEYEDYDDYEKFESRKMIVRSGYNTPSIVGRFMGGLICMINTAAVFIVVLSVSLFLINTTPLKDGALSVLYQTPAVVLLVEYASKYALDLLFIGVMAAIACKGRKNGLLETVRSLLVNIVSIVAVALCFYLPFSPFAVPVSEGGDYFLSAFVTRCTAMTAGLGLPETVAPIVGKILTGIFLAVFVILVLVLINWILKKLVEVVENVKFFRAVDGALSCVVYLVIGIVVVALVWAVWYAMAHYGLFYVEQLFTEESALSSGLFKTYELYLEPYLDIADEWVKNFFAQFGGGAGGA